MRIGIVTTWFERGAAYVSKQYADTLKTKHDVFIYARGGEAQAQNDSNWSHYNITWGDKSWGKNRNKKRKEENLKHFKGWISDNKLDIVFFNEEHVWSAVALCVALNVKTGAYVDYYTQESVPFFGMYDFLISNTKRHHGVFNWHPQSYFIPWGTDIELFKSRTSDLVDAPSVTFFHSAGMNPRRKGTDTLLRAFEKLSARHKDTKLIIHTQVPLKEFFPELSKAIDKLIEHGKLVYKEETIPAPGLYYAGDVYVYPTILEGVGLSIAEALASGLPVIVSDNSPMNEFVNKQNGILVKIKTCKQRYFDHYYWPECAVDEDDLVGAMEYYVQNKHNIKEFKKNARMSAEKKMDWKKNEHAIFAAFEDSKILSDKVVALKKIEKHERTKDNPLRWALHRARVLKFDVLRLAWNKVREK